MNQKIKVSIVDDHPLVIQGMEKMLSAYPHIELIGKYVDGDALLQSLSERLPDILLLDIQMPRLTGETLVVRIRQQIPSIKVIALTGHDTPYYVQSMLTKGCMGYLLKNSPEEEMIAAIETVYSGETYIEQSIRKDVLIELLKSRQKGRLTKSLLTRREQEILKLIVDECTSQEIADKLCLSLRTIEKYRLNLLLKLQAKNTAGLVKMAITQNLLD